LPTPSQAAPGAPNLSATEQLKGKTVESVRVLGNTQVSTGVILTLSAPKKAASTIPTRLLRDYQRVFG